MNHDGMCFLNELNTSCQYCLVRIVYYWDFSAYLSSPQNYSCCYQHINKAVITGPDQGLKSTGPIILMNECACRKSGN